MEAVTKENTKKNALRRTRLPLFGLLMFLLGVLILAGIRFSTIKDDSVHYHANFELYINGQRDEFKSFTFYEEVAACTLNDPDNVKTRVHMHDQNAGLIHVHAHGVTWGQFFDNLGYTLGDKVIATDNGVFADGQDGNHLNFLLNGQPIQTVADRVIKSTDRLLINYGNDDVKTIQARYQTVPTDAAKANATQDPASCSGSPKLTFSDRLKQAFGLPAH